MRKGLGGQRFTLFGELERDGRGAARHRPRGGEEQCRRYELRPDQSRIPLPANRCPRLLSGSGQQQSGSRKVVAAEGCSALVARVSSTGYYLSASSALTAIRSRALWLASRMSTTGEMANRSKRSTSPRLPLYLIIEANGFIGGRLSTPYNRS